MSESKNDSFGDKIKELESISTKVVLNEDQPIIVRLDGKAFHTFTRGLDRPFDERLSKAMIETMNYLVEKTDARLGYTQSDEITLVYFKFEQFQQGYFGNRVQKLVSVLASMATAKFNAEIVTNIPEKKHLFAFFDCRVWNVPTMQDAADVIVWRQEDAIKNAISMAAQAYFSHKQLNHIKSAQKIEMLAEKGIIWDEYPDFFKSGTFAAKKLTSASMPKEMKKFSNNYDVDHYFRSSIENYSMQRLLHTENYTDLIFAKPFACRQLSNQIKLNRKSK